MTTWTTTFPVDDTLIHGAHHVERTSAGTQPYRLSATALAQAQDAQLAMAAIQPSGVRVAIRTEATAIELDTIRTRTTYAGLAPRPDGVIELVIDGEVIAASPTSGGNLTTINMATGSVEQEQGPVCTTAFTDLPAGMKTVELWLPHNEATEIGELRTNAAIAALGDTGRTVWLHHGSSISHGSNAVKPTSIWPAVAARLGDVELTNMGFGGSALLDQFTARTIRDSVADVISVKIGINIANLDLFRKRALASALHGFLDTIRDGHPETPLLVVSPIYCGIQEETPGPVAFDPELMAQGEMRFIATGDPAEVAAGRLTLQVIREELARVVAQRSATDANLHLLSGLELYGEADAAIHPLPDGLHPDAETHVLMGERFAALAFGEGGSLATR